MKNSAPGPVAQMIDAGFAFKLPHCVTFDKAFGFQGTEPWSFEGSLRMFFAMRRPGHVWLDIVCGFTSPFE